MGGRSGILRVHDRGPSFLTGKQQGVAQKAWLSSTLSFVVLVVLVIFVTLDLNQPRRGLIMVNREPFMRLIQSIGGSGIRPPGRPL